MYDPRTKRGSSSGASVPHAILPGPAIRDDLAHLGEVRKAARELEEHVLVLRREAGRIERRPAGSRMGDEDRQPRVGSRVRAERHGPVRSVVVDLDRHLAAGQEPEQLRHPPVPRRHAAVEGVDLRAPDPGRVTPAPEVLRAGLEIPRVHDQQAALARLAGGRRLHGLAVALDQVRGERVERRARQGRRPPPRQAPQQLLVRHDREVIRGRRHVVRMDVEGVDRELRAA